MSELEIKDAVRRRDGHACTECGMTQAEHLARYRRDLDVHRLVPGSKYTLDGCVTVCRPCHGSLPRLPKGARIQARLDAGRPVPLGAEIDAELNRALEAARHARKWSRRTFVEEALRLLIAKTPPPGAIPEA